MAGKNTGRSKGAAGRLKGATVVPCTSGGIPGSLGNLSRREPAMEVLTENEQWFQRLVETTRIIAWEADLATWCFTYVGAWAVEILGYPLTDWFKEGFWVDHIHPEDREAAINDCAVGTRHDEHFELEYRMVHADGRTVWFHDIVHVVRGANGPETIKGFLIDITERKQAEEALRESEERLRLALQASATGTFEINFVSGEAHWNTIEFELLGLKPGDAAPGPETFFRFVHPDDVRRLRAQWEEAKHTGKFDAEFRIVRADGAERWLAGKGRFAFDGKGMAAAPKTGGRPSRFMGVNFDVTERRRLEAELLEVADREQRRIGHDLHDGLGQQLTALEMKCFLLLEDLAGKDLKTRQERLQTQARQLSEALRECITATRSLARGLAPVDLKADGLMGALKQLAHRAGVPGKIECRLVCRVPVTLHNSQTARHLYRIAQEAVNNALKHARPRRIQLNLSRAQGALRLQVKDDGCGLPERRKKKSGMGLEIMRHRAHVIGASLKINSKPKQGVTVTCTLPFENHEH